MRGFFQKSVGLDPGWLFVLSGLLICSASLLVPAQMELAEAKQQLSALQAQEQWALNRLAAYDQFMGQLDSADPGLIKRLASRRFNMLPEGDTPVLMDVGASEASIEEWIESTVSSPMKEVHASPSSMLATISAGPYRPWFLACGVACIFIGLLTSIETRHAAAGREISPS